PRARATARATSLLPTPAGPSMATTSGSGAAGAWALSPAAPPVVTARAPAAASPSCLRVARRTGLHLGAGAAGLAQRLHLVRQQLAPRAERQIGIAQRPDGDPVQL